MRFRKGAIGEIVQAAAASADEICGLLIDTPDGIAALPCRNIAADPRTSFEIDPAQLIAAHRAARAGGPSIVGCYHSHPGGEASPSDRDAAAAEPNGWLWLIAGSGEARLYRAVNGGTPPAAFEDVVLR